MAIALVTGQGTGLSVTAAATVAKAYTTNVTTGSLLVCAVTVYDATKSPVVTDNINGIWSQALSFSAPAVLNHITRIFYCPNAGAGATTVTASWTGTANAEIHQGEFSGAAISSPFDQSATGSNTAGPATVSNMLPTANGELLFGWCGFLAGTGNALGSGYTQVNNAGGNLSEYQIQTTAASVAVTWSSGGAWVAVAASFRPSGITTAPKIGRLTTLGCGG